MQMHRLSKFQSQNKEAINHEKRCEIESKGVHDNVAILASCMLAR